MGECFLLCFGAETTNLVPLSMHRTSIPVKPGRSQTLAQLVEQRIRNAQVGSSSLPSSSTVRLGDALFENPPKKLSAGACTC